jgi:crotonobetainyl-CoA:carnitine CoA-transferase CaiB-like acyl-CoA transferase
MQAHALHGLKVLEFGQDIPAAYCARQFAVWGAEVAMLEPSGGHPLRKRSPKVGETSLLWEYVAAGKSSLSLETACPDGQAFLTLVAGADILVIDHAETALARFGLTLEGLHADFPRLIIVALSPFGRGGPFADLAASELTVQALAGYACLNGGAGRPPLKAPGHILAYACGVSAFVAAMAALVGRLRGGAGALVDAAEFETITAILPLLRGQYSGTHPVRGGAPSTGVRALPCTDGYVSFLPPPAKEREAFGEVLDIPPDAWPEPEPGLSPAQRQTAVMAFLAQYTAKKSTQEVFLGLLKRSIVCGIVSDPARMLKDPHLAARGFFLPFHHPELGEVALPGPAAHLSQTPPVTPTPAPAFGSGAWTGSPLSAAAAPGVCRRPLEGVKLIDCTQAWIGPFAALLLADLGAETIKIEYHQRPDVWRRWSVNPAPVGVVNPAETNASPNYNSVNRNKRCLCLNYREDEARDIFRRLAADADLVMENFTPRVMDRHGLGHADLAKINPRLVMTSFSGYGKTGPLSDYKANGASIEGNAGWDHFHRYPGETPMVMGFYQADAISGLQMAAVTLVALAHQTRTGEGQAIDGSMLEAASGYIGETLLDAQFGQEQTPAGNRDPDFAPNGVYPCAEPDRWIAITAADDGAWARLVAIAPDLAQPRFATAKGRLDHQDDLDAALGAWTGTQEGQAAMDALQGAGVPSGIVRSLDEVMACRHLAERDWFRPASHADVGDHLYNGHPWRFAGIDFGVDLPPPRLGEHSRLLLTTRLGYSDAQVDDLIARNVTGFVYTDEKTPLKEAREDA